MGLQPLILLRLVDSHIGKLGSIGGRFMRWDQILSVLKKRWAAYIGWLFANLGGLIVAYVASVTIWAFHNDLGRYLPGPEIYLITGTITLSVAGVSYINCPQHSSTPLLPLLSNMCSLIVTLVYGVLVVTGVKAPVRSIFVIWTIAIGIFLICLAWSSITWLHEQAIRMDSETPEEPRFPLEPPPSLRQAAAGLPKMAGGHGVSEEGA